MCTVSYIMCDIVELKDGDRGKEAGVKKYVKVGDARKRADV